MIDYPTEADERRVLERYHQGFDARHLDKADIRAVAGLAEVEASRAEVRAIVVEPDVLDYVRQIVAASRNAPEILLGGSPRASVGLLLASKAVSALRGKFFVGPDEVKEMTLPVLRHRLVLRPEAEIEGVTADQALRRILEQVPVPR